jgi:hypothetical protein
VVAVTEATLDERRVRAAKNQALFREVNERIEELGLVWSPVTFVCECLDTACSEAVSLTRDEYESVRREPGEFMVLPGHLDPRVEQVARRSDRYWVVRKLGSGYAEAVHLDPRGSQRRTV